MNKIESIGFLPDPEQEHYDYMIDQPVYDAIVDINQEKPKQLVASLREQVTDEGIAILGSPEDGYSTSEAIVLFLPHANGMSNNSLVKGEFLRRAAKQAEVTDANGDLKPVIIIPSPTFLKRGPELSDEELQQVESGDFSPYVTKILQPVWEGDFEQIDAVGHSLGGTVAVTAAKPGVAKNLDVKRLSVGDPANTEDRTSKQLKKDFSTPGIGPTIKVVDKESKIDVQRYAIGKKAALAKDLGIFASSTMLPFHPSLNDSLQEGLSTDTFISDFETALGNGDLEKAILTIGANSLIAKQAVLEPEIMRLLLSNEDKFEAYSVAGMGHEFGDFLAVSTDQHLRALR